MSPSEYASHPIREILDRLNMVVYVYGADRSGPLSIRCVRGGSAVSRHHSRVNPDVAAENPVTICK